jgi:hypothetical protein
VFFSGFTVDQQAIEQMIAIASVTFKGIEMNKCEIIDIGKPFWI